MRVLTRNGFRAVQPLLVSGSLFVCLLAKNRISIIKQGRRRIFETASLELPQLKTFLTPANFLL
jgi:hypothetical protein